MMETKQTTPLVWHRINAIEPGEGAAPETATETVEVDPAFHVTNEQTANWVCRHIVQAREMAAKAKAWAEREIAQAERDEAFFLARFGVELQAWLETQIAEKGGKRKSIDLPAGRVGFRAHPARLVVANEPECLEWCREHLPVAVVKVPASEHLSRSELIQQFKNGATGGEIPPGADLSEAKDELYVK